MYKKRVFWGRGLCNFFLQLYLWKRVYYSKTQPNSKAHKEKKEKLKTEQPRKHKACYRAVLGLYVTL